jgi:hypothetical protein
VASRRLCDALGSYAKQSGSNLKGPSVFPRAELPDIVVPKIGLSLDAIVSILRTLLHLGNRQTVSGEFVIRDNLAWLRVRVDGVEVYSSLSGVDVEQPDAALLSAAADVMEKIRPYLVASIIYTMNLLRIDGHL